MAMGFQGAFQLGKKLLRLPAGRKVPMRNQQPPPKSSNPGGFMVHPSERLSSLAKDNLLPAPKEIVGPSGPKKRGLLRAGRKGDESGPPEVGNRSTFPKVPADQKLLNSFPGRKNAELRECSRRSEVPKPGLEAEEQMAVVFFLTRKLLSKTATPLDNRLIRDDDRLERALGEVHPRLPMSVRLVLRKKRYIQFMLDNRERLIP